MISTAKRSHREQSRSFVKKTHFFVTIQVPPDIFSGVSDLRLTTDFLTELTEFTELLERGLAVRWGDVEGRNVRGYW